MGRLDTVHEQVKYLLTAFPVTRDSDKRLIGGVYQMFYGIDVYNETFAEVLFNEEVPAFETIRRCRQKIQASFPELRGKHDKERLDRQKEFVEYAIKGE
jgi:hypothetical protein